MSFNRRILAKHKIFENNERGDPLMLGHVVRSIIEIHNENVLNLNFPGNSNLEPWNHGNLATVKGGTLSFCIHFSLKSLPTTITSTATSFMLLHIYNEFTQLVLLHVLPLQLLLILLLPLLLPLPLLLLLLFYYRFNTNPHNFYYYK